MNYSDKNVCCEVTLGSPMVVDKPLGEDIFQEINNNWVIMQQIKTADYIHVSYFFSEIVERGEDEPDIWFEGLKKAKRFKTREDAKEVFSKIYPLLKVDHDRFSYSEYEIVSMETALMFVQLKKDRQKLTELKELIQNYMESNIIIDNKVIDSYNNLILKIKGE